MSKARAGRDREREVFFCRSPTKRESDKIAALLRRLFKLSRRDILKTATCLLVALAPFVTAATPLPVPHQRFSYIYIYKIYLCLRYVIMSIYALSNDFTIYTKTQYQMLMNGLIYNPFFSSSSFFTKTCFFSLAKESLQFHCERLHVAR